MAARLPSGLGRPPALRHKWVDELWADDRETLLFVGNQHQQPDGFLVLGVFWPPNAPLQLRLG